MYHAAEQFELPFKQPEIMTIQTLENLMLISEDTKKGYAYDKSNGTWSWFDRSERGNVYAYHTGFTTFFAALSDAVAPYLE